MTCLSSSNYASQLASQVLMLSASSARESRTRPGLFQPDNDQSGDDFVSDLDNELTPAQAWCLYLSHFLSMWNSRTYEYGAVPLTN